MLQDIYTEIMSEASRWEESGTEYEDIRELGVSEGLLLASEIVKKAMKVEMLKQADSETMQQGLMSAT
ncbi:MAG: hypothetical protein K1W10_04315 [Lachnospiraceae bacterium]